MCAYVYEGYSLPIMRQPIGMKTVAANLNSVLFIRGCLYDAGQFAINIHTHTQGKIKSGSDNVPTSKKKKTLKGRASQKLFVRTKDHSNWIGYVCTRGCIGV